MTWQPKSSLTVETSPWTSSNMDSVSLHSSSRLWDLDLQIKCDIYFNLKRGLWTPEQPSCFFILSPVKILLMMMFLFQNFSWSCLSVVTLDALIPSSVHSLWSSPKCLNCLCLTVFSTLRSSQLLVHIFLPNFFLLVLPWTATPFSNGHLGLTLFVEGVNDRLLDHCQVSSVPHYYGFKKQEMPRMYTVWMVMYRNSNVNILIYWDTDFLLSLAVSSNYKN